MATLSGFSSPPSNPNSQFLSPMLQTYLEQQQQQCLQPPNIDPSQEQVEEEEEGGGGTDDSHTNFLIKNLCPIPNPCSSDLSDQSSSNLLHVSFNQDYSCFAAGFDRGFRIYNCDPFREIFRRDFGEGGGVAIVEMLFRFNILAFVGGGRDGPRNFTNKVMIWDDHKNCCLDQLSFRSEVRGVRLRTDRVVIVLEQKIYVYDFSCFKLMHQIETIANPKGLCAVSQTDDFVLVCPGLHKGQVRVEHYASKRSKLILAHDSGIASFALSQDGHLLATASVKGTLVRIFDTDNGNLLQELRRGTDRAQIYSLSFSSPSQWLAVSSDKGTVHVFGLKINLGKSGSEKSDTTAKSELTRTASGSSLSFMKGVLPKYFNSEWSVAKFRLPEGSHFVVGFGQQKHTILILGLDGSFYRCQFDPVAGGEMTRLQYSNFLKPAEESL